MKEHGEIISAAVVRLLQAVRMQTGLTMEELADRARVHRTYIGLLEQGKRQPTIDTAVRIAEALGIRLSNLLTQAEDHLSQEVPIQETNTSLPDVEVVHSPTRRLVSRSHFLAKGSAALSNLTGLDAEVIALALESCYHTLDLIDEQLLNSTLALRHSAQWRSAWETNGGRSFRISGV